jgi:hypothetical protein
VYGSALAGTGGRLGYGSSASLLGWSRNYESS